jgi:CRP/FNR family transcriptional regulator
MTYSEKTQTMIDELRQCKLFSDCDQSLLERLARVSEYRSFSAGDCVFDVGEPSEELFVMTSGRVSFDMYTIDGKKMVYGFAVPYMVAGDTELFMPSERMSRATTVKDTRVIAIPVNDFLEACRQAPVIFERLLTIYARRLQQVSRFMLKRDDEKLLSEVLLNYSRRFGRQTEQGTEIQIKLSQEELATQTGVPRQRINRIINQWKKMGWLDTTYSRITLVDMSSLKRFILD